MGVIYESSFRDGDKSDLESFSRILAKPYGGYEIARRFVEMSLDHYFVKLVEDEKKKKASIGFQEKA